MKRFFIISIVMLYVSIISYSQENNYVLTRKDSVCEYAKVYAKHYYFPMVPYVWTAVSSVLLTPVTGLVSALIMTNVEPKNDLKLSYPPELNLTVADPLLNKYTECYKKQAFKKKKTWTWVGFGMGTGLFSIVFVPLIIKDLKK